MAENEPDLFADLPPLPRKPPISAGLELTAQPGRSLTKAQASFNRLVARVEKLRAEHGAEARRLDAALGRFVQEIHPRLQRITVLRAELIRALAPFLADRRIKGVRDRRALRDFLGDELDLLVLAGDELPEDLRVMYREIFREDVDAADTSDFEQRRAAMAEMFEAMGVDLDLSDLKPDMDDAEVAARVKEKLAEAGIAEEPAPRPRAASAARTKREQAKAAIKQAAAELRQKTLGSIYKQLAKVLHPDLEQNPAERARKVALMQELTVAHRAGDLHTLLRLEIEWLHQQEGDATRLTDEKLAIFNTVLREQVAELEREILQLPHGARYQALERRDGGFFPATWTGAPAELRALDERETEMKAAITRLREPDAVKALKSLLAHGRATGWR